MMDSLINANFPCATLSEEKESSDKLLTRYNMIDNIILTGTALLIMWLMNLKVHIRCDLQLLICHLQSILSAECGLSCEHPASHSAECMHHQKDATKWLSVYFIKWKMVACNLEHFFGGSAKSHPLPWKHLSQKCRASLQIFFSIDVIFMVMFILWVFFGNPPPLGLLTSEITFSVGTVTVTVKTTNDCSMLPNCSEEIFCPRLACYL